MGEVIRFPIEKVRVLDEIEHIKEISRLAQIQQRLEKEREEEE